MSFRHRRQGAENRVPTRGEPQEIECDFIGGCDGFHGVCRPSIPAESLTIYDREYPFGWLGILAEAPPVADELIYAYHPSGFSLFACARRRWCATTCNARRTRTSTNGRTSKSGTSLKRGSAAPGAERGPLVEKVVAPMRSFVAEPMQHGRLFLAGDTAHIVPPTGAKGMNLAFADVRVLSRAIAEFYKNGATAQLEAIRRPACGGSGRRSASRGG